MILKIMKENALNAKMELQAQTRDIVLFAGTELLILLKHVMTGTQKTETGAALNVPLNKGGTVYQTLLLDWLLVLQFAMTD